MGTKIFTKEDVLQAAKIWDEEPGIRGFKMGTRYEIHINGKTYPPKAIASIANEIATAGKEKLLPQDFLGALDGKWHRALAAAAPEFKPVLKKSIQGTINASSKKTRQAMNAFDDEEAFIDGAERKLFKLHVDRERNSKVIQRAKSSAKVLCCEACGFDFSKTYGDRGEGYIEGHHKKPISQMDKGGEETRIKDIALVCSNCHRMLHRMRPLITVEELKNLINKGR